jgi:hypothetical protein
LSNIATEIINLIEQDNVQGSKLLIGFDGAFKSLNLKDNSNYQDFYNTISVLGSSYKLYMDSSDKKRYLKAA